MKDRLVLSDAAWERMAPLIIGRPDQKGSTGRDEAHPPRTSAALTLIGIESERLKLPAPFSRRIAKALNADAAG